MIDYEIILPKKLFQLYDRSTEWPGDNVHRTWADVLMKEGGRLCIEENSITYSAHSIGHNTGKFTIHKAISFEQLPELIKQSGNSAAAKYLGMNKQNWRDYIKEPKPVKKPSKYPSMNFGKYEYPNTESLLAPGTPTINLLHGLTFEILKPVTKKDTRCPLNRGGNGCLRLSKDLFGAVRMLQHPHCRASFFRTRRKQRAWARAVMIQLMG